MSAEEEKKRADYIEGCRYRLEQWAIAYAQAFAFNRGIEDGKVVHFGSNQKDKLEWFTRMMQQTAIELLHEISTAPLPARSTRAS